MLDNRAIDKTQLVARCQAGDKEAQGLLYTTYRQPMMKVIRQYVGDYCMAQDVLHDGFLIVLSQIQSLRYPERLEYWMGTIMKNLSIHSSSKIQFTDITDTPVEEEEETYTEENSFSYDELLGLVGQLPHGYQTVFRLSVLEGKSHNEIADMLGITPHTSASQLMRAKEKLRRLIQEYKRNVGILFLLLLLTTAVCVFYLRNHRDMPSSGSAVPLVHNTPRVIEVETPKPVTEASSTAERTKLQRPHLLQSGTSTISVPSTSMNSEVATPDSILKPTDSERATGIDTVIDISAEEHRKQKEIDVEHFNATPSSARSNWTLSLSMNSLGIDARDKNGEGLLFDKEESGTDGNLGDEESGPDDNPKVPEPQISAHHLMPITFGIRIAKEITHSWSIEWGLQYSLLRTDISTTDDYMHIQHVRASFLTIPIDVKYNFLQRKRANAYIYGGGGIDIPIGASIKNTIDHRDELHYPFGVTLNAGLGIGYKITPSVHLFVQPSLNYHIMNKSTYPILWQDKPFTLELPIGIRLSW